jgi:hypothetical protein
MFEKRYEEYVQENGEIVREYRERGLLVEVDTGKGTEESWEKLYNRLEKDVKWTNVTRPAKRRKLPPTPTDNVLTPPDEPTPVDNHHRHTPGTSRSPSITVESALIAEYQGFLKRTRIGNKTTYNLEFQLPHIPEHLHLPILSEALGMRSNKETSAEAASPHTAGAHSKMHFAAPRPQIKRVRWAPEEDATILKMREDGCSWEEIHAALPSRTLGTIQVRFSTKLKK